MKKTLLLLSAFLLVISVNAQTINEIVKSYSAAIKQDKLSTVKSIKITGKVSAMGMEMPVTIFLKNPNKIKTIISLSGQEMITVFDGEKGYTINPMNGGGPVELTGAQLQQAQSNNVFNNTVANYFQKGHLTLEGSENVNNKPAFKLKAMEGTTPIYLFIDKATYLLVKTNSSVDQMGTTQNVDTFLSDYSDISGVVIPKKTSMMANGIEAMSMTFDKVEVNVPIEDSLFKVK
jgi:outer membrane lipoprotein-sorting protein